jgi:hypothetical protein
MEVSFEISADDASLIGRIAERARKMDLQYNERSARKLVDWRMDFTAVHANGNPLRLADLLAADDFNFIHDAFGIANRLDRDTGKLTGFFSPRFSARATEAA